jgi:hypothetical protein
MIWGKAARTAAPQPHSNGAASGDAHMAATSELECDMHDLHGAEAEAGGAQRDLAAPTAVAAVTHCPHTCCLLAAGVCSGGVPQKQQQRQPSRHQGADRKVSVVQHRQLA